MRNILIAGALLGILLCSGTSAQAAPTTGDPAAAFEGKEFFNTEPVSLADLRGRVVFLELFATT